MKIGTIRAMYIMVVYIKGLIARSTLSLNSFENITATIGAGEAAIKNIVFKAI